MKNTSNTTVSHGITLGGTIPVTIRGVSNHSILWAILHGIFGWFYVIYYAFLYSVRLDNPQPSDKLYL